MRLIEDGKGKFIVQRDGYMTEEEFKKALEDHDWYYSYSDNIIAHRAGDRSLEALIEAQNISPKLIPLYEAKRAEKFKNL